jgi:hypothetical protein
MHEGLEIQPSQISHRDRPAFYSFVEGQVYDPGAVADIL